MVGQLRKSMSKLLSWNGSSVVRQTRPHLSDGERSNCEAIRVRGEELSIDRTPSPQPSPIEVGYIRLRRFEMPNSGKPELGGRGSALPLRKNRDPCRSSLVEPVERVQRANREFGVGGVDQHRKLDLGGGNGADVDVARRQR